jgi:hypothetical protein
MSAIDDFRMPGVGAPAVLLITPVRFYIQVAEGIHPRHKQFGVLTLSTVDKVWARVMNSQLIRLDAGSNPACAPLLEVSYLVVVRRLPSGSKCLLLVLS